MAYIGKGPVYGNFQKQTLTVNGITTDFQLDVKVGNAASILVSSGGVIQDPGASFSVIDGGTKIHFTEAPTQPTFLIFLGRQYLVPTKQGYETALEQFVGNGSQNIFVLQNNPVVNSGLLVYINGILQTIGAGKDYTLSGLNIIFSSAPANGVDIDVYILARERVTIDVPTDSSITRPKLADTIKHASGVWTPISASKAAVDGEWYLVDTLGGPVTITLPASPTIGQTFKVYDAGATFGVNNCTVANNGKKINGMTAGLVLAKDFSEVTLVYSGEVLGWTTGKSGGGATGGGSDEIFYENGKTVTQSYSISDNKNAMTAGPVTIANGVTVTVPNGSVWTVI